MSVVIPARNAAETIGRTLEALQAQDLDLPFEVVVVDDGSSDDTAEIAARAPQATVLRQEWAGPAAARNRGVAAARAAALAFTDADCFPSPEWLREGLAALVDADLVQGPVRPDRNSALGPFDRTVWVGGEDGLYETANLFVRRELFDRLGGFEEWLEVNLGKPLAEDLWFGWRARRAGARTGFCERALVEHAVFARGALEFVAERARLFYFPRIAAKMPELRQSFFYRRWFLNRRSAALDVALLGLAVSVLRSTPLPLIAAGPYARMSYRRARPWGSRAPAVAAADLAADLIGLVALAVGTLRSRTPLL